MHILNKLSKIIFYSFLLFSQLNSFVNFKLMQKDGNMILAIGDVHYKSLSKLNKIHVTWLQEVLNIYQSQISTKIIYELSEEIAKLAAQEDLPSYLDIASTFFYLAQIAQNFSTSNNIKFLPFECRGRESDATAEFFLNFRDFFEAQPSLKQWEALKRELFPNTEKSDTTLKTSKFLESLRNNQEIIQQWQNTFKTNSSEYKIFNEFLLKYKSKTAKIEEYLQDKPNVDIRINISSLFDACITGIDFKNKCQELFRLFCHDTDYIFADLGFLNEILKSLHKGLNKIILIAGLAHTKNISIILEQLGYTMISEFSIISPNIGENNFIIQCNDIMDLPNELLPALHLMFNGKQSESNQEILETIKKSEEFEHQKQTPKESIEEHSTETVEKYCNHCKTHESKEKPLSRCSRCQKAFYCNQICQKKDWPQHKLVCK